MMYMQYNLQFVHMLASYMYAHELINSNYILDIQVFN